jgi:NitT/TauT family transport system substrate-binding protein
MPTSRLSRRHAFFALAMLVAAVVAAVNVTGAGARRHAATTATTVTINMGTEPWIGYGPWWIAKAKGFDKANGINLNMINFTTDADRESAFAGGKTDMSNVPTHALAKILNAGSRPFKTILFEDISMTADAMIGPKDITSIKQLKGKKVAFEAGTTSDILLRYGLMKNGMTIKDIKVVPLAAADAGAALVAGRVNIAVTYEPYLTAAIQHGKGLHIIYAGAARPGLISDCLIVSTAFAKANPAAVVAALKTWQQAMAYFRSNPADAQKIIAAKVGATPAELKTSFAGDIINNTKQSNVFIASKLHPLLKDISVILRSEGVVKGNPNVIGTLDPSYGKKAVG